MAEQDDIRAMAQRFFDAIEAGDIETMQGSFTPDAEIWHNTDELIVTPAQTAQTLTGMVARSGGYGTWAIEDWHNGSCQRAIQRSSAAVESSGDQA